MLWHKAIDKFDYQLAVDWAIDCIRNGIESENLFIVAGFSPPYDREEMAHYLSATLRDLNLNEKYNTYSDKAYAHFLIQEITQQRNLRKNILELYNLSLSIESESLNLETFYLYYHSWESLEYGEYSYSYLEGLELHNIESKLIEYANQWLEDNHLI